MPENEASLLEFGAHRSRLSVDERRGQLLELGLSLFADRSYDDISIDDIAAAAGISRGLLYHYFGSKRGYYVAALREAARQLIAETEQIREAREHQGPPDAEALRSGMEAYLAFVEKRAKTYSSLFQGGVGSDEEVRAVVEETRNHYLSRILGDLPLTEANQARLRTALRGWIGFVEAVSLDWLEQRAVSRDELRDLIVDMCLATIERALR